MNWIKQMIKMNIANTFCIQRRALIRAKGIVPVWHKGQTPAQFYVNQFVNAGYSTQTTSNMSPSLLYMQQKLKESNGLLEIVPKASNIAGTTDKSDFSEVSQENFTHALQFSKTEIEMGNFTLADVETVKSQSIENLSITGEDNIERHIMPFEDNQLSTASYTERVVGSEKEPLESLSKSASF